MMSEEIILTPYHKWTLRECRKDRTAIAHRLFADVVEDRNPLAYELLEMTGDTEYTKDTFFKAADILLEADQR